MFFDLASVSGLDISRYSFCSLSVICQFPFALLKWCLCHSIPVAAVRHSYGCQSDFFVILVMRARGSEPEFLFPRLLNILILVGTTLSVLVDCVRFRVVMQKTCATFSYVPTAVSSWASASYYPLPLLRSCTPLS